MRLCANFLIPILLLTQLAFATSTQIGVHDYVEVDLAQGTDTDGDGLREAIVDISIPSLPRQAYVDVLVLRADIPAVSARLIGPDGREISPTATWDGHYKWTLPSPTSGIYKLYLEERQRTSKGLVRVMTPLYFIEDNLIRVPAGNTGAPAKWSCYDLYTSIDEKGYSPVIWQVEPNTVTVQPGQEFDLRVRLQLRQFSYFPPGIIWQVFLVYSWAPAWPPPEGYYYTLYDGIPSYSGVTIDRTVRIKAPDAPGEYYIYICVNQHYGMSYALQGLTRQPQPPAHAKVVVTGNFLPLREITDIKGEPLPNVTVVVFSPDGKVLAAVKTDQHGRIPTPLPKGIVRVAWGNGWELYQRTGRPEYVIWIYDQTVSRDLAELGDASTTTKIRTYVYPLTVTVYDEAGKPQAGLYVEVRDAATNGELVYYAGRTNTDGAAGPFTVPTTSYYYSVYNQRGALVAVGKFDIQRGATVPATGWNIPVKVASISQTPVKNSDVARGFIVVRGVRFTNGTTADVTLPFTVSNGVLKVQGELPLSYSYPAEVYVTHVTLGGQEVPVKGGKFLVYKGYTTDLAAGLDFAELGLTGVVSISAVDSTGAPRSDWTVQVLYGDVVAAEGKGSVNVVLPRTDVLSQPYMVRVITNFITPEGKALVKEQMLEVRQKALAVQISVSMVRVVVQVVDGFGNVRSDWPVVVENVASGMGHVEAEVVEGQRYVVRATGLGFTNTTAFTAKGPQMVVAIKIPTAKITAQVKDGFGKVRNDWPVEVVGVVAGQGTVGPVEVLAGQYTIKTSTFGKEFTQTVTLRAGEAQTVTVQVPTARLSVVAVDDDRKPIDRYVTAVQVIGPVLQSFSTPPKDLEVLAGQYTVTVSALGKQASTQVTLQPGQTASVEVVVPGTAGLDFGGTRIPLPTLVFYAGAVLAVVIASVFAAVKLRRRGGQASETPPPMQTVPQLRVGEGGVVGDFCLEYQGGVIPLSAYTVVGRRDFSGLPEHVLELIDERHFAVYYRDGVWWVEDLGSRHGTYLNGVKVKKEKLREGDVISPVAVVTLTFKRCGTTRRVVPMEDDTQLWK